MDRAGGRLQSPAGCQPEDAVLKPSQKSSELLELSSRDLSCSFWPLVDKRNEGDSAMADASVVPLLANPRIGFKVPFASRRLHRSPLPGLFSTCSASFGSHTACTHFCAAEPARLAMHLSQTPASALLRHMHAVARPGLATSSHWPLQTVLPSSLPP